MTRKRTMMWMFASVGLIATAGAGYSTRASSQVTPKVTTVEVTRGALVQETSATGTLEAVTTVNVGTQVSGIVQALYADFNAIVKKGQMLARLDPSLLQTQVEQAEANLIRAEADLERLTVSLADAKQKLERARGADREAADAEGGSRNRPRWPSVRPKRRCRSTQALCAGAGRSLNQAEVNLDAHRHHRADRRHRDLAQRRHRPDGRGEHAGADALHPRGRPHAACR